MLAPYLSGWAARVSTRLAASVQHDKVVVAAACSSLLSFARSCCQPAARRGPAPLGTAIRCRTQTAAACLLSLSLLPFCCCSPQPADAAAPQHGRRNATAPQHDANAPRHDGDCCDMPAAQLLPATACLPPLSLLCCLWLYAAPADTAAPKHGRRHSPAPQHGRRNSSAPEHDANAPQHDTHAPRHDSSTPKLRTRLLCSSTRRWQLGRQRQRRLWLGSSSSRRQGPAAAGGCHARRLRRLWWAGRRGGVNTWWAGQLRAGAYAWHCGDARRCVCRCEWGGWVHVAMARYASVVWWQEVVAWGVSMWRLQERSRLCSWPST